MQTWQNNQKIQNLVNQRIQNLVNQKIQNLVNQKIHSSLRRCMLDRAMNGPGLNRSVGRWESRKNQVKHASSCFNVSSCCYSKTRRIHDIVGWAWASVCVERGLSSCMHMTYWNVTESITSGHRILHKMYIQKHSTGTVGLADWCSTTEILKQCMR